MKKQISILLILILAGLSIFTSCSEEEFLTEEPMDEIYASNLFDDLNGFEGALNSLYALTRQEFTEAIEENGTNVPVVRNAIWTFGVDNGYSNAEFSATAPYNKYGTMLTPDDKMAYCVFRWLYRTINAANMIIARAENPDVDWKGGTPEVNTANKNRIIAEAKFFRAWAYRHLTYTWGDVPLSLEEISGETYRNDWERNSVADIREVMEQDLLFAETYLPDAPSDPGKLAKAVAQHYLAELYLATGDNALARTKALAVCSNPRYKLITERYGVNKLQAGSPFSDMFFDGNILPSEGNTEALWVFINAPDVPGGEEITMRRSWIYTGTGASALGIIPSYE
ncbi:MAG: RagB/SusD family nutrient uptake outer membrane protein, partial [Bacteroidales bacterium]|nr:RagB/SusD family nutrient uptake outer membrane protein [Bacteroidales bacterium]